MMRALLALLLVLAAATAPPARAEGRDTLGVGRMFSNDYFGDGHDRWRTASYALSVIRGKRWAGAPPDRPGSLLEYRFRNEIIAPSRSGGDGSGDRPYVGALSFGVHSHWSAWGGEVAAGADLVTAGPQSGVYDLQEGLHELLGAPSLDVEDGQVDDVIRPAVTLAYARPWRIAESVTIRPFAEGQAGVEDILRFGGDVVLGAVGHDDLWLRDEASGQLYRGIEGEAVGIAVVAGADWARIGGSLWLPDDGPSGALDERYRARVGIHWQIAPGTSFFYGLAYLSPEFEGQGEGQLTGQLKLNLNF